MVGNDKNINAENEKGYCQQHKQAKTKPPVDFTNYLFHSVSGGYDVEGLRDDLKRNGGFPQDFTIT